MSGYQICSVQLDVEKSLPGKVLSFHWEVFDIFGRKVEFQEEESHLKGRASQFLRGKSDAKKSPEQIVEEKVGFEQNDLQLGVLEVVVRSL